MVAKVTISLFMENSVKIEACDLHLFSLAKCPSKYVLLYIKNQKNKQKNPSQAIKHKNAQF